MLATTFGVGQVVYSLLWFFLLFIEVWLMISIFIDIFRSHDLKGWAKALWVILVLLVPLVGILLYVIVRGDKMRAHQAEAGGNRDGFGARADRQVGNHYRSKTDELARLAELRDRGDITAEQFRQLRDEIVDGGPTS